MARRLELSLTSVGGGRVGAGVVVGGAVPGGRHEALTVCSCVSADVLHVVPQQRGLRHC